MNLTAKLLGVAARPRSPWSKRLALVADRLVAQHGVPRLGNFRDPVKEIFYILLSAKTTDSQYRATHRRLWTRFPKLTDLARAPLRSIRACIESGGLAGKRTSQIQRTARALLTAGGRQPSRFLKALDDIAAYEFLRELPGLGPKSALCILMYSLDADAFPVDVNVQRIAERLGAIPPGLKHYQAQQQLAAVVPAGRSRELHIAMVVHGRKVCGPRNPQCSRCVLVDVCRTGRKKGSSDGQ
ncbi:MAG: hypothetical protein K2P78_12085 [Gemmataceae bacterium]|nr:hypothetical protein [Gemmataceae bacterium]